MKENTDIELETLIILAAYFLFDLQCKLAKCCEDIKGTVH